jgi:hypothetical protein
MKLTRTKVFWFLAQLAAGVTFSQAMSFARWNQWKPLSAQINFHAALLAVLAIGLFFAVSIIHSLTTRIENLERVVASAPQPSVPADPA